MLAGQAAGRLCPNTLSHATTDAVLVIHTVTCPDPLFIICALILRDAFLPEKVINSQPIFVILSL